MPSELEDLLRGHPAMLDDFFTQLPDEERREWISFVTQSADLEQRERRAALVVTASEAKQRDGPCTS